MVREVKSTPKDTSDLGDAFTVAWPDEIGETDITGEMGTIQCHGKLAKGAVPLGVAHHSQCL
jgi:hypothetical protein